MHDWRRPNGSERRNHTVRAGITLGLAVLGLSCLTVRFVASAQQRTVLFAHVTTDVSAQALRRRLQRELPAMKVSVFGRVRDFRLAVRASKPDAVLARRPLLEELGLHAHVQGHAKGLPHERYVVLSRGVALSLAELPESTIGMVDLLDHDGMLRVAQRMLAGHRPKTLRRVPKPEDLIAMLRLDLARAVLLPSRMVDALKASSEMPMVVTPLEHGELGLPAVHVANASRTESVLRALRAMTADLNRRLGVDEWR